MGYIDRSLLQLCVKPSVDLLIGLNENSNSFFATRCRFWSSKNICFKVQGFLIRHITNKESFPVTAVHKAAQHSQTLLYEMEMKSDQSPQISVMQRRGL